MTIILKDDNNLVLPQKIQDKVNNFIDNLPKINWLKPSIDLKKEDIEKQVELTLKCFKVKAEIEYKKLLNKEDGSIARDSFYTSNWDSAWDLARDSSIDSAVTSNWNSAWDLTWDSTIDLTWSLANNSIGDKTMDIAWTAARISACASQEILLEDNTAFNRKYPQGAFKQLFRLWEMGLYPAGILGSTKKFTIYIPPSSMEFSEDLK